MSEKSYYDRYWTDNGHESAGWMVAQDPWEAACLERVIRFSEPVTRGKVLDIGCGDGTVAQALAQLKSVDSIIGIDLAPAAVERAKQRVPDGQFLAMSADVLDFPDNHFDTLFAIEVVEHLVDISGVFQEFSRVLKPGGHLVITTTDFNWPKCLLIAAFCFERYFYPTNPHIRFFTHRTLRRELEKVNLHESAYRWNGSYCGLMPKGQILITKKA